MAISEDEDDEDVDLASLDIEENGDQDMLYIPVFLYFTAVIFYRMSTFWFCWVVWHVTSHDRMLRSKGLKF